MNIYDEEFIDEFDDINYNEKPKTRYYVMSKEEFVARMTADLAARKKERLALARKRENENRAYMIDKIIYNRKKRNRR